MLEFLCSHNRIISKFEKWPLIFDSENANCEFITDLANNAVPAVYSYSIDCEGPGLPWVETEGRMWNA